MSDAFLVLAQTAKGLSCFSDAAFYARRRNEQNLFSAFEGQTRQSFKRFCAKSNFTKHTQKLSAKKVAAWRTLWKWCATRGSTARSAQAGTLRRAVAESIHHCHYRKAFGKLLVEQPLMQNLLADLALESEAATALGFRLARGFDESEQSEQAKLFTRAATAIGKFWNCKRAVFAVGEAIEILGGNGYVEDSVLPRLYRDIPVNSIWEGSGNVQCFDVLRSINKEPESIEAVFAELENAENRNKIYDNFLLKLKDEFSDLENLEFRARIIVEKFALCLQAKVLLETAPDFVSEAFCIVATFGK